MTDVFLAGYQGHRLADLIRAAEHLEAVVVDIRYKASSFNPEWSRSSLRHTLATRYEDVWQWGNSNYSFPAAPIVIEDFASGLERVRKIQHPVILLCRCPSPRGCHRSVIGARLAEIGGFNVQELDWQAGLIGSLFETGI